jgi:hypothetical protein
MILLSSQGIRAFVGDIVELQYRHELKKVRLTSGTSEYSSCYNLFLVCIIVFSHLIKTIMSVWLDILKTEIRQFRNNGSEIGSFDHDCEFIRFPSSEPPSVQCEMIALFHLIWTGWTDSEISSDVNWLNWFKNCTWCELIQEVQQFYLIWTAWTNSAVSSDVNWLIWLNWFSGVLGCELVELIEDIEDISSWSYCTGTVTRSCFHESSHTAKYHLKNKPFHITIFFAVQTTPWSAFTFFFLIIIQENELFASLSESIQYRIKR